MPWSGVLELEAEAAWAPPAGLGRQGVVAHAAFLDLVRRLDQPLGERLHGSHADRSKPFTLSPFFPESGLSADARNVVRHRWGLRLTCLDTSLAERLEGLLTASELALRVGDQALRLTLAPGEPTGSRQVTYGELLASRPPVRLRFRFATPTTFRSGERNLLFPSPAFLFHGLQEKWGEYSDCPLPSFPAATFDACLNVARYDLNTTLLDFGRYRQVGFVGTCEYLPLKGTDAAVWQAAAVLARFAPFAGVGYKTTMGMGQVTLL